MTSAARRMITVVAAIASTAESELTTTLTLIGVALTSVLALAGAIYTASSTLRQSTQTNRAAADRLALDRDTAHDARVDAEVARLRAELAAHDGRVDAEVLRLRTEIAAERTAYSTLTTEHRTLAEQHARLRVAVIRHNLDPDVIIADTYQQ